MTYVRPKYFGYSSNRKLNHVKIQDCVAECLNAGKAACGAVTYKKITSGTRCFMKQPGYSAAIDNSADIVAVEMSCLESGEKNEESYLLFRN